jgi:hypothetical protein
MNSALGTALIAALAIAGGLGIARAGPDTGPKKLPISGVVRDEQGRPIPHVWIEVEGWPETLKSPPPWTTDVHGRFQTDDVPRGPAKLLVTADKRSRDAEKKVVETRAGVRDLVIVLDPGPQLFLRIVDYVPGETNRWAHVLWDEPDGETKVRQEVRHAPIREDGWTRFVALPPDREFELWAEAVANLRHVRARGLKSGDTEQRIEVHEVKDIAGQVRGSKAKLEQRTEELRGPLREHLTVDVFPCDPHGVVRDLCVARTRVREDGSFRIRGLPPGTYLVDVGTHAGEIFSVSKQVEAGTTDVVIDLD